MAQLLITHSRGLSLTSLTKPFAPSSPSFSSATTAPQSIPLTLPSRFPPNAQPSTAIAPTGHIYLWAEGGNVVWEYDHRARRVSEISFPGLTNGKGNGKGVEDVLPFTSDAVVCSAGAEVRMMRKEGVKWSCVDTLPGWNGQATAIAANSESNLLAIASSGAEPALVVYDQKKGEMMEINLRQQVSNAQGQESMTKMVFAPSLPSTLVIPATSMLLCVTVPVAVPLVPGAGAGVLAIRQIHPFGPTSKHPIIDLTFSPVLQNSDGKKKGGLCAVLNERGEVALVGLDAPDSAAKLVSFACEGETRELELVGITFMDGATLAVRTERGTLLVKDLRALSRPPVEIPVPHEGIRNLQVMPVPVTARSARQSTVFAGPAVPVSRRSSAAAVLGENTRLGNALTPSACDRQQGTEKGKGTYPARSSQISQAQGGKPRAVSADTPAVAPVTTKSTEAQARVQSDTVMQRERETVRRQVDEEETRHRQTMIVFPPEGTGAQPSKPRSSSLNLNLRSASASASASTSNFPPAPVPATAPRSRPLRTASAATPLSTRVDSAIPEEEGEEEDPHEDTPIESSVELGWALNLNPSRRRGAAGRAGEAEVHGDVVRMTDEDVHVHVERFEELRRELGAMQMDMLRMSRGLKNEIRQAVRPLILEIRENKEVMERQRREIERLRRGY